MLGFRARVGTGLPGDAVFTLNPKPFFFTVYKEGSSPKKVARHKVGFRLGTAPPPPVTVYIRDPVKGYI